MMARIRKDQKPPLYLFGQRCPDPTTGRVALYWQGNTGHTGYVSLQICHLDASDGEVKPRFIQRHDDPASPYGELTFACAVDSGLMTTAEPCYGWRIGFQQYNSEQHPLEFREIERMYRVLRPLLRRYEAECERLGRPRSFGQFVVWHLSTLDVRGVITRAEAGSSSKFTYSDSVADTIDHIVMRVALDVAKLAGLAGLPATRDAA